MWTCDPHPLAFTSVSSERFPAFHVAPKSALGNAGHPSFLLRPCSLASWALHHLSAHLPPVLSPTACARSPGGSLISRLTALLRFGLLVSQTPVPKRRGIFLNTALICVFLHSKPVMVPCGTCAPMTAGACLSIPTTPHHTASQGTCHSLSRWPHAPEPSSVLLFLSLRVGPPHTLFPRPSPPVDPTCSSGPSSDHREPAVTQLLTLTSPFSKCLLKSITSLYVALYSPLFLVCSC